MTGPDLAKLEADVAAQLRRLGESDELLATLRASLKVALADGRAVVARLEELDKAAADAAHRQTSLRSAFLVTLDYLDKVAPIDDGGGAA
jgi:hypothetical protein